MTPVRPSADIVKCCFAQTSIFIYKQYLMEKNKKKNTVTTKILHNFIKIWLISMTFHVFENTELYFLLLFPLIFPKNR